ncbi:MAG: F0F1 ATP synthase subunit delta, partial [Oscillospiraceae bacterium]|nr:F0F1 ATP synthase subunit delta [Oscillospiraceae bacterium]
MSKTAKQYARDCIALGIPKPVLLDSRDIFDDVPDLSLQLSSPIITLEQKFDIIDRVFPQVIRPFIKDMVTNADVGLFRDTVAAYEDIERENSGSLSVTLRYVTPPTDEQLRGIRRFVLDRYPNANIAFRSVEDQSLVNGFKLTIGNMEYDWSAQGRMNQLQQRLERVRSASAESIISILRAEVENFDLEAENKEVGVVMTVGDGIATIDGIDHAAYGEIVQFDSGIKGMVQDVRRDSIGVILFGGDTE